MATVPDFSLAALVRNPQTRELLKMVKNPSEELQETLLVPLETPETVLDRAEDCRSLGKKQR